MTTLEMEEKGTFAGERRGYERWKPWRSALKRLMQAEQRCGESSAKYERA